MDLPLVKTPVGQWFSFEECRVMKHGSPVVIAVVVAPQATADVLETSTSDQIASCSMNGIPWVTDIAAITDARL